MIHSFAPETADPTEQPRVGRVGLQTIEDTGRLTQERMKTFDEEKVLPLAEDFMSKGMQQRSRRSILPAALTRDRPPEQASRLGHRPTF